MHAITFLQDLAYRNTAPQFQPGPDRLLPGIAFVAFDLLLRSHLNQIRALQPPRRAALEPRLGLRPQLVAIARELIHIDLAAGHRPEAPPAGFTVAGPLCEAGDVFTQAEGGAVTSRTMPTPEVGDLIVFHDAGAYGASMSSNYNSRPLAAEVLLDAGHARLIRRRQSIGELLALEHVD